MGRQSVVLGYGGVWWVVSDCGGGGGWWLVGGERCGKITEGRFFSRGHDLREIVPKLKSNPASSRAPPLGEQAGPSLALGLTIQMFFSYITEVNLLFCSAPF